MVKKNGRSGSATVDHIIWRRRFEFCINKVIYDTDSK